MHVIGFSPLWFALFPLVLCAVGVVVFIVWCVVRHPKCRACGRNALVRAKMPDRFAREDPNQEYIYCHCPKCGAAFKYKPGLWQRLTDVEASELLRR